MILKKNINDKIGNLVANEKIICVGLGREKIQQRNTFENDMICSFVETNTYLKMQQQQEQRKCLFSLLLANWQY
jgi:hypothetical protein